MRRAAVLAFDLAIIAIALPIALFVRENFVLDMVKLTNHIPFLVATTLLAIPVLSAFGVDRVPVRYATINDHLRFAVAIGVVMLAATIAMVFFNRLEGISRSTPALQGLIALAISVGIRALVRRARTPTATPRPFAPIEGTDVRSVLLVGLNPLAELYVKATEEYAEGSVRVVGIVDYTTGNAGMRVQQLPVFGGEKGLQNVINELAVHGVFVDRLVVTAPMSKLDATCRQDVERFAASSTLPVEMFADNIGLVNWGGAELVREPKVEPRPAGQVTFVFSDAELAAIARRPYWRVKRAIDVVVSLGLLIVLAPIAVLVAIGVALDIGRPVIFWQVRPGVGGRSFKLLKFRTMSDARDSHGRMLTDDERLGRIGDFLRKTRLDEIPQLLNILRGEMSLIGPRPMLWADQARAYSALLLVRPGLTGWGQIKGGRDIPAADKAALDIWYVRNASFKLDIEIIMGTIRMVLQGERVHRDAIDQAWRHLRQSGVTSALPDA